MVKIVNVTGFSLKVSVCDIVSKIKLETKSSLNGASSHIVGNWKLLEILLEFEQIFRSTAEQPCRLHNTSTVLQKYNSKTSILGDKCSTCCTFAADMSAGVLHKATSTDS